MRKVLVTLLSTILLFIIVGCNNTDDNNSSNNGENNMINDEVNNESNEIIDTSFIDNYEKPQPLENIDEEYEVIVIGGEPEGVAAAVSAARNGSKTLLVESREELGGLFTYGMLNFLDIPQGVDGESVSKGIYEEWHQLVGGKSAFGILEAKAAFKKLVDEEDNLSLTSKTEVIEPLISNDHVEAVTLENEFGTFEVHGKTFIDATQDADFAVMSNVPYFVGGEDIGIDDTKMAVTLMIHLENVSWDGVKETVETEKFGESYISETAAWGFPTLIHDYTPKEENTRLRGLNLAKVDDEYFINALQIFDVDGLSEEAKQEAIEKGKRESQNILKFLQEEFPGFEEAEIVDYPTELYVRETRHILSEYQLPMSDVWINKDHWDSVALGAYPVDVQAMTVDDYGYVISDPIQYAIPFRTLVPLEIDSLLVVGRSSGYSSLAAGSARVVPTGMATGEAAGAAAALAVENNVNFREMSQDEALIETLRDRLSEQGAFVDHFDVGYMYEGEWFDDSIQNLINYRLVLGGYTNDLQVDEKATLHSFTKSIKDGLQRVNPDILVDYQDSLDEIYQRILSEENKTLMKDEAASLLEELFLGEVTTNSWDNLINEGILNDIVISNVPSSENDELLQKDMFAICSSVVDYIKGL